MLQLWQSCNSLLRGFFGTSISVQDEVAIGFFVLLVCKEGNQGEKLKPVCDSSHRGYIKHIAFPGVADSQDLFADFVCKGCCCTHRILSVNVVIALLTLWSSEDSCILPAAGAWYGIIEFPNLTNQTKGRTSHEQNNTRSPGKAIGSETGESKRESICKPNVRSESVERKAVEQAV